MLRIRTLGGLGVQADGHPLAGATAQPRRLAILAVITRAGDRGVTRDKLISLLYPDSDEERARRALNQALYALRRDLGSDEAIGGVQDLHLNRDLIGSDIAEFEAACASDRLDRAAALYGGPFLDGFHLPGAEEFERWADSERTALGHRISTVLEKLARVADANGDHPAAVGWWRRLAAADPLSGRVAIGLMQALAAAGDRQGAILHARVHAVLLGQELDAPPDTDVAALAERLRKESVLASPPRPADPAPAIAAHNPEMVAVTEPAPAASPITPARRARLLWLAVAALIALAAMLTEHFSREAPTPTIAQTAQVSSEPDLELDPSISPDGRTVAYSAGRPGQTRIFIRQLVGGGRVIDVGGTAPMPQRVPQWSPDGTRLAFQAGRAIYTVAALGGPPRLVIESANAEGRAWFPTWSPDGKRIAYVDGVWVAVRSLVDGNDHRIAKMDDAHSLRWSPDGRFVAAVNNNAAFVTGAPGPTIGAFNIGNVASSVIWVIHADTLNISAQITASSDLNVSPTWTPDSRHLLFISNHAGNRDVYLVPLANDGRPERPATRLTTGLNAHSIWLSSDGRQAVYSVFAMVNNIWAIDIPAAGAASVREAVPITRGTQAIEGLAISHDGKWLAYDSDRSGNQDIWRQPLDGTGEPEQLTTSPHGDFMPKFSPDGKELAYYSLNPVMRKVQVIAATGGAPQRPRPIGGDERYPDWSPDGRTLVYGGKTRGDATGQLYLLSHDSSGAWGEPLQLTSDSGSAPRWSPDGRTIAYFVGGPRFSLRLVSPDGGTPRILLAGDGTRDNPHPLLAEWAPDSRTLYIRAADDSGRASIWSLQAAGGTPRLVVRFDDASRPTNRAEFATDGRRIFFTLGKPESDLWMMTFSGRW